MSVRDRLSRLISREQRHCECRRCGRNLDCTESACPACGGTAAEYEL